MPLVVMQEDFLVTEYNLGGKHFLPGKIWMINTFHIERSQQLVSLHLERSSFRRKLGIRQQPISGLPRHNLIET